LRTFDDSDSEKINLKIREIAKKLEEETGVEIVLGITLGADGAVINTPKLAKFVRRIA